MTLKVEINNPEQPEGTEFDLGGILVPNGESVELSEEQERDFVARHKMPVKTKLAGNLQIKVTGKSSLSKEELDSYMVESSAEQVEEDIVETTPDLDHQGSDE